MQTRSVVLALFAFVVACHSNNNNNGNGVDAPPPDAAPLPCDYTETADPTNDATPEMTGITIGDNSAHHICGGFDQGHFSSPIQSADDDRYRITVTATGPSIGAFGAGAVGDTVDDKTPTFTTALASSAGAAALLGVKDEFVITLNGSSAGTPTDHYTFTLSNIELNVGSAVPAGSINLHAYMGDGTGSLALAVG